MTTSQDTPTWRTDLTRIAPMVTVNVKLRKAGVDWVDDAAMRRGITRSEMIREMLGFASAHIPRDPGDGVTF
jgi:hypothetical protein